MLKKMLNHKEFNQWKVLRVKSIKHAFLSHCSTRDEQAISGPGKVAGPSVKEAYMVWEHLLITMEVRRTNEQ